MQRVTQKRFGSRLRRGTFNAHAGCSLGKFVRIAHNSAGGINAHVEFFLLQGTKKTRLPVPDVDVGCHHLIRLREAYFAFEVGFGRVVHVKNDARIIAGELRSLGLGELFCLFEGGRARNLEVNRRFGEGLEKIFIRHARAQQACDDPDQQNFYVFPVEPL